MSAKTKNLDMTVGRPVPTLLAFAIPMAIGSLFQALYNTCDSIIVGRFVGSSALAAIGATSTILHFLLMLTMQLTSAFSVVLAQYFGAKRNDMIRKTVVGSFYIAIAGAVVISLVGLFFARPLMVLMQADESILDDAVLYLRVCISLCLGQVLYNTCSGILRAIGDSRTPLYFLIFSSVLNVILNLLFVVVFKLAVLGVAIATVISQFLSAGACMVYAWKKYPIFRITVADLKPDWGLIGKTLVLALSMSLHGVITQTADVIISACVNSYGPIVVAGFMTVSQLSSFATLFFSSLAMAFSVFVGQNVGAGQIDRMKKSFLKVLLLCVGISLAGTAVMLVFGRALLGIYLDPADANFTAIMDTARQYQVICASFYPALATVWLFNQTLRGAGDALAPLIAGISEVVCKLGCALGLAAVIGVTGVYLGSPTGWFLGTIPLAIRYFSGSWRKNSERLRAEN